jgi:2-keto-4-pentenoate hydratase
MEPARIAQAAELLVRARRTGEPLRELPGECKPTSVAEVNAIIDEVTRQFGEPPAGWKIAFLYKPREPALRAPLYASRLFRSPGRVPLALVPSRRIEPEITFRATRDLPPRAAVYRPEEVADAVVACPSLELVDTRFDTRHRGIRQMLDARPTWFEANTDHITHGAFVVGEGRADWRDVDFARLRVVMRAGERVVVDSVGGHAFLDPFLPVVVMVNQLRHGPGLTAGQVVATGSFTGFFEVEADTPISAEFVGFGTAEATIVSRPGNA